MIDAPLVKLSPVTKDDHFEFEQRGNTLDS